MKRTVLLIASTCLVLMPQVAFAQGKGKSKSTASFQESCAQAVADVSANSFRGVIATLIVFSGTLLLVYSLARWRRTEKQKNQEYKELKALRT